MKFIYDDVGDGDVGGCHLWHSMFKVSYILIFGFLGVLGVLGLGTCDGAFEITIKIKMTRLFLSHNANNNVNSS